MRVATIIVSAACWGAAALASVAGAQVASAATPEAECDQVSVVIDYNALGGDTWVGCAGAGTAAEVFHDAGIPLEFLPQQPGFVCRVSGLPDSGPCSDGRAYWSLWYSDGTTPWSYASLGVTGLELDDGGFVGFAWHEGSGEAAAPDVPVAPSGDCPEWPACETGGESTAEPAASGDEEGSFPLWATGGVAVLVLGAAAVPMVRRRRERTS